MLDEKWLGKSVELPEQSHMVGIVTGYTKEWGYTVDIVDYGTLIPKKEQARAVSMPPMRVGVLDTAEFMELVT